MGNTRKNHLRYLATQLPKRVLENNKYGLTLEEKAAIWSYTGHHYQHLNYELWKDTLQPNNQIMLKVLLNALEKLPRYTGIAYRKTFSHHFPELSEGQVFTLVGLSSFTEDLQVARDFEEDTIFVVQNSSDRSIKEFSRDQHEREVIYPNGAFFCSKESYNYRQPKYLWNPWNQRKRNNYLTFRSW